jgi:hypothetical protein
MANVKISQLPVASALAGETLFEVVQGGVNKKTTLDDIQAGLTGKANTVHGHTINDVANLQSALDGKSNVGHQHPATDITDSTSAGRALLLASTANAQRTLLSIDNVNNTSDANKPVSTAQQTALDGKSNVGHQHTAADITNFNAAVNAAIQSVARTFYVQGIGSDTNDGSSLSKAVATIERAIQLATASGSPALIEVYPGDYVTQGNLDLPDGCVIRSAHRTATIRPAPGFETRNVFRMGSGCFIEGFLIEDFRLDSLTDPTSGFAFSFRPGAVINRVPYASKCAIRTGRTWGPVAPPLDRANQNPAVGIGGGVVLADGLVCSPYSPFPNIMTWGATPVSHNGIGYCAKNGGLINAVNAVSMWAHKHFLAMSGGQIILSACSTQFGDFSLAAEGYREIVVPADVAGTPSVQTAAATAVAAAQTTIINNMWAALVAGGYTTGWTAEDETFARYDAALFLQCVRWGLEYANEKPIQDFAAGLFNAVGAPVFDTPKLPAFVFSFNNMRDQINALGIAGAAQTMVINMTAAVVSTISNPTPPKRREPSKITAIGHTWTAVMAGVALARIPPANNAATIRDSILEQNEGEVVASGQDDQGNAIFVGGLEINADTGELTGPPFDSAVRRVATRTAIARSF